MIQAAPFQLDRTPLSGTIESLGTIRLLVIEDEPWFSLWNHLVSTYHPLGHKKLVGRQIKHLVLAEERPVAALAWRAAALHLHVRDEYIGWSYEQRKEHLHRIVSNSRLLVLPWVSVSNLVSHVLALAIKQLPEDWQNKYGNKPVLLESFVDSRYFQGTVYKAANWIYLGKTKGFTKVKSRFVYHGQQKDVYVYPLQPDFRRVIAPRVPLPPLRYNYEEEWLPMVLAAHRWDNELLQAYQIDGRQLEDLDKQWLAYFHTYDPCFTQKRQLKYALSYVLGLLSDLERKSIEPIALRYLGTSKVRRMQNFMRNSPWDHWGIEELYLKHLAPLVSGSHTMLCLDSSEFPKKGKHSVGVARQYCGRFGKVENCQSGVFLAYSSERDYGLLTQQLYLPQEWFTPKYDEMREECSVPEDLRFMSKLEIARRLMRKIEEEGSFPGQWIGADSTFGDEPAFRDTIGQKNKYFVNIRSDTKVWLERPAMILSPYNGRGRRPSKLRPDKEAGKVSDLSEKVEWHNAHLGYGSQGAVLAQVAYLRVVECRENRPGAELWLVLRRYENEVKYYFSNAPADTAKEVLLRALRLRWPIEQCFQESKSELGMADYESRSWDAWHRHMILVNVARLFLLKVRQDLADVDGRHSSIAATRRLVREQLSAAYPPRTTSLVIVNYYLRRAHIELRSRYWRVREELRRLGLFRPYTSTSIT